jgi:hypothetical protein
LSPDVEETAGLDHQAFDLALPVDDDALDRADLVVVPAEHLGAAHLVGEPAVLVLADVEVRQLDDLGVVADRGRLLGRGRGGQGRARCQSADGKRKGASDHVTSPG